MANWLPMRKCRVYQGGVSQRVVDGTYKETASKFDCTPVDGSENANGLLAEQIGVDTVSTTLSMGVIVKSDDIRNYAVGTQQTIGFTDAGGKACTGTAYILSQSIPIAAKGAYKITLECEYNDVVTGQ